MVRTHTSQYTSILIMTKHDDVAARIVARRAELGWSQEQLSKETGVAAAQISRYEARVNKPRANVIAKLAKGMLVPFSWLAYGDTSEFIQSPLPEGEIEFSLSLPSELADFIDKKSAQLGIQPHEVLRKMVVESFSELQTDAKDNNKQHE
ncbi:helix-turn-helix domain-containing protein [Aeromonas sp. 30P]|uniref:helix-turn-helix domain-containing protein n=1 Tax=Aeromonas sp. 30P TaxID=3452717 RepID=UPI003F78D6C2